MAEIGSVDGGRTPEEENRLANRRRGSIIMWVGIALVVAGIVTGVFGWSGAPGVGGFGLVASLWGGQMAYESRKTRAS